MGIQNLQVCHVTPSAGAAAEQIIPLLYFDVAWIPIQPTQTLYFYDFPHSSESHFMDTIVPNLKKSLSLTLKHFLPLAGKIVVPLSSGSGQPFSHYMASRKDSIPLTISVSDSDFFHLTANHPKDVGEFHELVPQLPHIIYSSDSMQFAVLALQVTLFPRQGVCMGVTNHHAQLDAHCLIGPSGFLQTWASINRLDREVEKELFLPSYNRSVVQDARSLTTSFWNHVRLSAPVVHPTIPLPRSNLRATFLLSEVKIQLLKNFLRSQTPAVGRASSYVAVTAHMWSCMAEARAAAGEKVEEDEPEYLSVSVECRGRLTPPLPSTYFGNCSIFVLAELTHGLLKGGAGFVAAARAIAAAIKRCVDNERGVVAGAEGEYLRRRELIMKRRSIIGVSGSIGLDLSGLDYGWGEMRKAEVVHIDYNGAMGLFKTKEGVEVGLSMPKPKMDAFEAIFKNKLSIISNL